MLKKLLFLISAAFIVSACSDKNDNGDARPTPPSGYVYADQNTAIGSGVLRSEMLFFGASNVKTLSSGALFSDPTARFEFKQEDDKIYLYMHATRFAAGMPAMEMRITAQVTFGENTITMRADEVTPQYFVNATQEWVDGTKYPITKFSASVSGTLCGTAFTCTAPFGTFDVSYLGYLIVKAK